MRLIFKIIHLTLRLLAILGVAAVILALLLFDYMSRTNTPDIRGDLPPTAIVFTGHFDRIHSGLDLLSSGSVDRLFITGVNGDAGLNVARFPEQFELNSKQAGWIANGKIVLAPDAHSTFENALETACWLEHQPDIEAVALITSRRHMARASVALQHGIAPISVVPVVSDPSSEHNNFQIDLIEFGRFSATWVITLLPSALWPANEPALCQDG